MDLLKLKIAIVVFVTIYRVQCGLQTGNWTRPANLQGMVPSTDMHKITTITTRSVIRCLEQCLQDISCVSAFYEKDTGKCHLHDQIRTNTRLMVSNPNASYFIPNRDYPIECFYGIYETQYNTVRLADDSLFTYRISDTLQLSYANAVAYCKSQSASLMHVSSKTKQEWLANNLNVCVAPARIYVDSTNQNAANFLDVKQWVSSDGLFLNSLYWALDEPSLPDSEHCATAEKQMKLRSTKCNNLENFICEM